MTPIDDGAARAALWQAWRHHATHAWTPARHNPHRRQYDHALLRGWLWEPRPGALAITPAGLEAIAGYMPRHRPATDLVDEPAEASR